MEDLYSKLIEAYSDKNLNRITGKLIELYKSGMQEHLFELEYLYFVNLSGNDIPESQLRILNEKEVVIIY
jgi:hypothetical protein